MKHPSPSMAAFTQRLAHNLQLTINRDSAELRDVTELP